MSVIISCRGCKGTNCRWNGKALSEIHPNIRKSQMSHFIMFGSRFPPYRFKMWKIVENSQTRIFFLGGGGDPLLTDKRFCGCLSLSQVWLPHQECLSVSYIRRSPSRKKLGLQVSMLVNSSITSTLHVALHNFP